MAKRVRRRKKANGHKVKSDAVGSNCGKAIGLARWPYDSRRLSTNLKAVLLLLASAVPFITRRWLVIGLSVVLGGARQ